ncbi:hypothetical protein MTO98_12845 [Mucilaginibacter sp. SMC90]|uniref:hypothetical protein n=1 Tax=Mucilaginibacter sp. SMC90 TaxID=2929803 RepID=UPI001FB4CF93|nr:hypothetical protein [Mucilaginibacter sp. SMC90]UOE51968.1 hypothetical protein MTO98_12845 [Mucilaginibacter sp. SMC90]
MKAKLQSLKADLYNVFVVGNADDRQLAKAYFLLAIPLFAIFFGWGSFPKF